MRPSFLRRHPRATRRGQSLVEFALVSPLLVMLVFGIVDFGRAIYYENAITNAAREGSRVAILPDNPCNTVYGGTPANSSGGSPSCGASGGSGGTTVCGAVEGEASIVGHWSCTEGGTLPSGAGTADTAYVEVDQYQNESTLPPCTVPSPNTGANAVVVSQSTPRSSGNYPVAVTVRYYYRPLTPFLSSFFPSSFYIASTSCVRQEY